MHVYVSLRCYPAHGGAVDGHGEVVAVGAVGGVSYGDVAAPFCGEFFGKCSRGSGIGSHCGLVGQLRRFSGRYGVVQWPEESGESGGCFRAYTAEVCGGGVHLHFESLV